MKLKEIEFEFTNYLGMKKFVKLEDEQLKALESYQEDELRKRLKATADSYTNEWVRVRLNGKEIYHKYSGMF